MPFAQKIRKYDRMSLKDPVFKKKDFVIAITKSFGYRIKRFLDYLYIVVSYYLLLINYLVI